MTHNPRTFERRYRIEINHLQCEKSGCFFKLQRLIIGINANYLLHDHIF